MGRLKEATSTTSKTWRRKRRWLLMPFLVLLLVWIFQGLLTQTFVPTISLALLAFVMTVTMVLLTDVIVRRWRGSSIPTWTGQVPLKDLESCPCFSSWSTSINSASIRRFSRGLVGGRISISPEVFSFVPGRYYRRAGIRTLSIPWSQVISAELIAQRLLPTTGLKICVDGCMMWFELRGKGSVRKALQASSLMDDPPGHDGAKRD